MSSSSPSAILSKRSAFCTSVLSFFRVSHAGPGSLPGLPVESKEGMAMKLAGRFESSLL